MKKIILLSIFAICFFACKQKNISQKEIQESAKTLEIHRYDEAIFKLNPNDVKNGLTSLKKEFTILLDGADLDDTMSILQVRNFLTDPQNIKGYKAVEAKYGDLSKLKTHLSELFLHCNLLMEKPEKMPVVYTYYSAYDYENRVIFQDSILVLALDLYLGTDYPEYPKAGIAHYLSDRCDEKYMMTDIAMSVANTEISRNIALNNFLDHIIYQGKIWYFIDKALPSESQEIKFAYSKEQLEWCKKNEAQMWAFFIQNRLLFEQDIYKFRNFIGDGPTTNGFPGSPSRLSAWFGYQIISKYVDKTGISMKELFSEKTTAQEILKQSEYKPK